MTNPLRILTRLRSVPLVAITILAARVATAQTGSGTIIVRLAADSLPIAGATIATGAKNGVTDQSGLVMFKLPIGHHTFHAAPAGFRPESLAVFVGVGTTRVTIPVHRKPVLPAPSAPAPSPASTPSPAPPPQAAPAVPATPTARTAPMSFATSAPSPKSVPDAQVSAATKRDDQRISDAPTYIQVAGREAVEEQLDRSPGDLADLLGGFNGVRVQPLSAGSSGVGIRIRGMPGNYAKILTDGLPLLGATPEGQDLLQTSALGVERVEVIPGVTSALYGPTSLSGSVNFVSAPPSSPSQIVVNGTTHEASDVAVFQTYTFSPQWAATMLAGRHYRNPGDPDGDGWAEVPGYKRVVVEPRVYWSRSPTSTWFMTGGFTRENRRSGTFGNARLPDFNRYSDDADTRRGYAGTIGRIQLDTNTALTVRASMTREWRALWYGDNRERDRRNEIFGDVSVTKTFDENVLTGGVAMDRDQYAALDVRDEGYRFTTPALYAQHTWSPDPRFAITSSARLDLQSEFGDFVSPRVSIVARPTEEWQLRLSRANGVYAPTPITDETEALGMSQLDPTAHQPEHALGWSLDIIHKEGSVEFGGSGYKTVVTHPLVVRVPPGSSNGFSLVNGDEPLRTQGIDVFVRYRLQPIRFSASYSYLDATRPEISGFLGDGFEVDTTLIRAVPFNPRHAFNLDWAYETEQDKVIGVSARFTGRQVLADSSFGLGQPNVTIDARLQKHIRRVVVFAYGKDLTGVHQLQLGPVLRPSSGAAGQWADNVWAPLDGRVINVGMRMTY